jgi:lysophospholipase
MKLVSIPANPAPENVTTGIIKTPDGVSLRFARWEPPPGRKGTVCIFPGRAEFIEKYFETVRDLRARGFAVAILDWRGQGLSARRLADPCKGHVRDFSEYDTDLETFMTEVVLPDCPPPVFALGHSMGSTVLIRSAHHGHRWFDRIVLSAPMIALPGFRGTTLAKATAFTLRLLQMGNCYIPGGDSALMGMQPFTGNPLTSDPIRYARTAAILEAAPELGIGSPTVSWASAAFRATREMVEPGYPAKIRQPIIVVAAGRDEIVSTPAIEDFAIHLRAGSHLIVAGAKHELLQEQDRYRVQLLAAFDAFVPGTPLFA